MHTHPNVSTECIYVEWIWCAIVDCDKVVLCSGKSDKRRPVAATSFREVLALLEEGCSQCDVPGEQMQPHAEEVLTCMTVLV